jgi:hypothetical protein
MRRWTGLALVAICLAAAGCGGSSEGKRSVALVWKTPPKLYVPSSLPRDRIVRGVIENESLKRKVTLKASDIKLLDADGRHVEGVATFIAGYAHSIYPSFRKPGGSYPESEQLRLGLIAKLKAGQSVPLTVSWHDPPGPRTPVRIDYGSGTLALPTKAVGGKAGT